MHWAAVLLGAVFLTYSPALNGAFIWDDDDYILNNATLRTPDGLARIWAEPGSTPQYYPLVFTTFWIEYQLWGVTPVGYHSVNVLLHGLNALLLIGVLRRLDVPGAWLAGALFALHPVMVESVAWITERKNVLSTAFYFLSLLAYLRYRPLDQGTRANWRWYALALGLFVLALFSKTVTCSLPAVIVLLLWWQRGRIERRDILELTPFFATGLALAALTVWMEKHHVKATGPEWEFSVIERILIAGRALWFYAAKLAWPVSLSFNYPRWRIDPGQAWQYVYPLAALGALVLLWRQRAAWGRTPLLVALIYAGTLLPALGFISVYPMIYSFVADHFQYLAAAAPLSAVAALAWRRRDLPLVKAGIIVVPLLLGWLTWKQAAIYDSLQTLWLDTLDKNPHSYLANHNLGAMLVGHGQTDLAQRYLETALAVWPNSQRTHGMLGVALMSQRRLAEAEAHLRRAVELAPYMFLTHYNLGGLLLFAERPAEALPCFEESYRLNPNYVLTPKYLGRSLQTVGRPDEARRILRDAIGHFEKLGDAAAVKLLHEELAKMPAK